MKRIGLLGLGAMGERMARNFLNAGFELHIYNRNSEKCQPLTQLGAQAHQSPAEVAQHSDVVIAMVRDDLASFNVWLDENTGAIKGLDKNKIAIEMSTLSLAHTQNLIKQFSEKNIPLLDAPVLGSRPQVEAKQLIQLVGGNKQTLEQVRDVLSVNAGVIHHLGETGKGMAFKLAMNGYFAIQVSALGELIGFLNKHQLDEAQVLSIFKTLPLASPALVGAATLMENNQYAPLFPIELVHKDLTYLAHAADMIKADMPLGFSTQGVFGLAVNKGLGDENIHGVKKVFGG